MSSIDATSARFIARLEYPRRSGILVGVEPVHELSHLFEALLRAHGPQHWWPAETPFEMMVGAVLTQNTSWHNASRGISVLVDAGVLAPDRLLELSDQRLAELLRSSGTFRVKSRRVKALCRWLVESGGYRQLCKIETEVLRASLLEVHGIGPETADAILLYAFERPVFIADAYALRLLSRWGVFRSTDQNLSYERVRSIVEEMLGADTATLNELHALIVHHCKQHCRVKPLCDGCPIAGSCALRLSDRTTDSRTLAR